MKKQICSLFNLFTIICTSSKPFFEQVTKNYETKNNQHEKILFSHAGFVELCILVISPK